MLRLSREIKSLIEYSGNQALKTDDLYLDGNVDLVGVTSVHLLQFHLFVLSYKHYPNSSTIYKRAEWSVIVFDPH